MNVLSGILSLLFKIYVGSVVVVWGILLFPLLAICTSFENLFPLASRLFIFWSFMTRLFCGFWVKRIGALPTTATPMIIASNHSSYLDIFLLFSILPRQSLIFLGKAEILNYPIFRRFFVKYHIPVDRKNKNKAATAYLKIKRRAAAGWSIVIFPEGGIPDENKPVMMPFKSGAFRMAKELDIPILPLTFTTNHLLFSDPNEIFGPCRPGISEVYIHPVISREKIASMDSKELSAYCFEMIERPLREKYPQIFVGK